MRSIRPRRALPLVLLAALLGAPGCRREEETITIGPARFTEEEARAIRSQDDLVNEEEGGQARVTRATRGGRKAR